MIDAAARLQHALCFGQHAPRLARVFEDRDRAARPRTTHSQTAANNRPRTAGSGTCPRRACDARERDVHLHRRGVDVPSNIMPSPQPISSTSRPSTPRDARKHFGAVHAVEVADDARDLRVVAFDLGHVFVELTLAQLTRAGRRHSASPSKNRCSRRMPSSNEIDGVTPNRSRIVAIDGAELDVLLGVALVPDRHVRRRARAPSSARRR